MIVEVDVHGMIQRQAYSAIDQAIKNANQQTYIIRVIHGYQHGTTLRNGIRKRYRSHPKIKRIELSMNPGITDLILKDL